MGYLSEVRPKVFYGKKLLTTRECDTSAAKLAKQTSSESNNKTDQDKESKKKVAKKGNKGQK